MFPEVPSFEYPADEDHKRAEIIREVVKSYGRFSGLDLGFVLRRMMPDLVNGQIIPRDALRDAFHAAAERRRQD